MLEADAERVSEAKRRKQAEAKVLETERELRQKVAEKEDELVQKVVTESALLKEKEGLSKQVGALTTELSAATRKCKELEAEKARIAKADKAKLSEADKACAAAAESMRAEMEQLRSCLTTELEAARTQQNKGVYRGRQSWSQHSRRRQR